MTINIYIFIFFLLLALVNSISPTDIANTTKIKANPQTINPINVTINGNDLI